MRTIVQILMNAEQTASADENVNLQKKKKLVDLKIILPIYIFQRVLTFDDVLLLQKLMTD